MLNSMAGRFRPSASPFVGPDKKLPHSLLVLTNGGNGLRIQPVDATA
jgi:hypothetical protein